MTVYDFLWLMCDPEENEISIYDMASETEYKGNAREIMLGMADGIPCDMADVEVLSWELEDGIICLNVECE